MKWRELFGYYAAMRIPAFCLIGALFLPGCGLELGYPGSPKDPSAAADKLHIFILSNVAGDMGGKKGIAGADELCDDSTAKPVDATFRALIVDGSNRAGRPGAQIN